MLRTWITEDYGGVPGVGRVLQHPRSGFIYVANGARILEFDGSRWRSLGPFGGQNLSFVIDAEGRLWFANAGDLGYLAPNASGELRAVSVRPALPGDDAALTGLGATLATSDGVFFMNRHRIACIRADGTARVWRFDDDNLVLRLWWQDDAVHVRGTREALRLVDGEFRPVGGLRTAALLARPDPAGGWQLVGNDGVRRWDGGYREMVVDQLGGDLALSAAFLDDGRIAFGTVRHGVVVCDRNGRREGVIDVARGLPSNRVESLAADREGGLWIGLRNGIVRVQLDSPVVRHGAGLANRIDSSPAPLALHRGELYVGGPEGLWRRDPEGKFHAIADVPFLVRSVVSHAGELYLTGLELRHVGADDRARRLAAPAYGMVPLSTAPGAFVRGTDSGVAFDRADGERWTALGRHQTLTGLTSVLCEWPAGMIWAANHGGLWQIDLRAGLRPDAPLKHYTAADGLPPGITPHNIEVFPWAGGLGVSVLGRLVRFDPLRDRFEKDLRVEGLAAEAGGFSIAAPFGARPGVDGSLWLARNTAASIVRVAPAETGGWRAESLEQPELSRLRASGLLHDPERRTLWVTTPSGLFSRDLAWTAHERAPPITAAIRRVETPDGKLLWADGHAGVSAAGGAAAPLALGPDQNAVRVLFTAPVFAGDHLGRGRTQFRTRLEGLDHAWSGWRPQTQREFTNLPYRAFVLQVQARTEDGRESEIATLPFSIAPPWWLTRWAFGGYGALGLMAVAGLFRWRTGTLRRRTEQLEAIVTSRTEELRRSNAELARLHAFERDEKLAARLAEEKARLEVLRYQLNPHFLFNALNSVCALINQAPGAARAMVVRIADFCRQTLRPESDEAAMTVGQELGMLRSYLEIEKTRLGELLTIEIDADPAAGNVRIPPFLLLPLVENAVKYGTATSVDHVGLRLRLRREADDALDIEVANTGEWLEPGAHSAPSTGIGIENLRQRLARYYPDAHEFTTRSAGGWVCVRLRLLQPMRETTAVPA